MRKLALILALLAVPTVGEARKADVTNTLRFRNSSSTNTLNMLEGVALNAAEATRTLSLSVNHLWSRVRVFVFHTNVAATTVVGTPKCLNETGQDAPDYVTRACSSGACTSNALVDTLTVSADVDWHWEYDVSGCWEFELVLSGASAGGSDLVDVQATAISGD